MANGWGGRRPGAGPHSTKDVIYHERKKVWVREAIEPEFANMTRAQISKALNGDLDAFKFLCSWAGVTLATPIVLNDNSSTTVKVIQWPAGPWDSSPPIINIEPQLQLHSTDDSNPA